MFEKEQKVLLVNYLTDMLRATKVSSARVIAQELVKALEHDTEAYNAARKITQLCTHVELWGGSWKEKSGVVRGLLSTHFATMIPQEEKELDILTDDFWKEYNKRFEDVEVTAIRESQKFIHLLDNCECVEDLFDLFDPPKERSRFDEFYGDKINA